MKIVIMSQKGSQGKSALACAMSVFFQRKGFSVYLMDADADQSTTYKWATFRNEQGKHAFLPAGEYRNRLTKTVEGHQGTYDIVIVDTGGKLNVEAVSAGFAADLILVPIEFGAGEAWSLESVAESIEKIRQVNEDVPVRFVGNRLSTNAHHNDLEMIREYINANYSEIGPVCDSGLKSRMAWKHMFLSGMSIQELNDPNARTEFRSLMKELFPEI